MTSNIRLKYLNLPMIGLFALLCLATSVLVSLASSTSSSAAHYPANPMSVRDDRCYSTLSLARRITGPLGVPNFGMVNAIMNAPIYDWDQGVNLTAQNTSYAMYNLLGDQRGLFNGLRGSLQGKSVGYAKDFRFNVSPIPNLQWMFRYIAFQLPNDAGKLAWLAGGPNPVATVDGSHGNPYIANPFLYTQSALIMPNGLPQFQAVTGPLNDLAGASQGNSSIEDVFRLDTLQNITNFSNYQLEGSSSLIGALQGAPGMLSEGSIADLIANGSNLMADGSSAAATDLRNFETTVETMIGQITQLPGLSHLNSFSYEVRGDRPEDNCYETLSSTNQVPAYAFSMPGATSFPVTMPGWIYSIFTLLDGKGFSSSGMSMYLGGSINGKAMLDCYGRGVQPMVTGHDRYKIRDFAATFSEGFATGMINTTIFGLVQAAALAADIAAPGSGAAIRQVGMSIPAITTKFETYTSGFAFMFNIEADTVVLPDHLQNRVVDYRFMGGTQSKTSDINLYYAIGGVGHDQSQNGQQFNPDVYLKLYRPYIVQPAFSLGTTPRETLDGHYVDAQISTQKYGFNAGNNLTPVGGTNYQPQPSTAGFPGNAAQGGPTYDVNADDPNTARAFTNVQVYKMVIKPGTLVNAIDAEKIPVGGDAEDHYSSQTSTAISQSTQACDFFAGQLNNGDADAEPSRLTSDGSNANRMLPNAPVIENRGLGEDANFTCGVVRDEQLKMGQNDWTESIYNERVEFTAETPPGTKVCFAVRYDNYTNDLKTRGNHWWDGSQNNYNSNYETPADKVYLSRANCIISGYKPSMQVRGGDLMTNGGVYTGTNVKTFLNSTADPKEVRTYGSWVEYGIIAKDSVNLMASGGLYRVGMPAGYQNFGYLTFANVHTSSGPEQGEYPGSSSEAGEVDDGFERVTRQFTSMSERAQIINASNVDLSSLASGTYRLRGSQINLSASSPLPANRSLILLIDQLTESTVPVVNINTNIQTPVDYGAGSSVSDISQVVIAPSTESSEYRLNIGHQASQVDAWLLNPNGMINTCYTGLPTNDVQNTPRAGSLCNAPLTVNGPVSAKSLLLRRDGGKDQSNTQPIAQSIPGENFNLRPDAYIWAAHHVDAGGRKYITTNSVDLPPRY